MSTRILFDAKRIDDLVRSTGINQENFGSVEVYEVAYEHGKGWWSELLIRWTGPGGSEQRSFPAVCTGAPSPEAAEKAGHLAARRVQVRFSAVPWTQPGLF